MTTGYVDLETRSVVYLNVWAPEITTHLTNKPSKPSRSQPHGSERGCPFVENYWWKEGWRHARQQTYHCVLATVFQLSDQADYLQFLGGCKLESALQQRPAESPTAKIICLPAVKLCKTHPDFCRDQHQQSLDAIREFGQENAKGEVCWGRGTGLRKHSFHMLKMWSCFMTLPWSCCVKFWHSQHMFYTTQILPQRHHSVWFFGVRTRSLLMSLGILAPFLLNDQFLSTILVSVPGSCNAPWRRPCRAVQELRTTSLRWAVGWFILMLHMFDVDTF